MRINAMTKSKRDSKRSDPGNVKKSESEAATLEDILKELGDGDVPNEKLEEELSKLDFSDKSDGSKKDEIERLSKEISEMSDLARKEEETIMESELTNASQTMERNERSRRNKNKVENPQIDNLVNGIDGFLNLLLEKDKKYKPIVDKLKTDLEIFKFHSGNQKDGKELVRAWKILYASLIEVKANIKKPYLRLKESPLEKTLVNINNEIKKSDAYRNLPVESKTEISNFTHGSGSNMTHAGKENLSYSKRMNKLLKK
jgi:hypothetical protein